MKRIGAILVILLALVGTTLAASAEAGPVARSGAIAAYTDGWQDICLPGKTEPINTHMGSGAVEIVGIDAYRLLYLCDNADGGRDLYMIDLESFDDTPVAQDVFAACLTDEDSACYVTAGDRKQLMRVNLASMKTEVAYAANEPIDRLYLSAEGLVVQLVDQAGTLVYVRETDRFDNYTGDIGREYDGLINHVTHALPQGQGIDECAVYADYFYLEALTRLLKPDSFINFWG